MSTRLTKAEMKVAVDALAYWYTELEGEEPEEEESHEHLMWAKKLEACESAQAKLYTRLLNLSPS